MLTIRSHLRNIFSYEGNLNNQIDSARSLQCDSAISLLVFIRKPYVGKRVIFKENVYSTVYGFDGSKSVYFSQQLSFVCLCQRRQKLWHLDLFVCAKNSAAGDHEQT